MTESSLPENLHSAQNPIAATAYDLISEHFPFDASVQSLVAMLQEHVLNDEACSDITEALYELMGNVERTGFHMGYQMRDAMGSIAGVAQRGGYGKEH